MLVLSRKETLVLTPSRPVPSDVEARRIERFVKALLRTAEAHPDSGSFDLVQFLINARSGRVAGGECTFQIEPTMIGDSCLNGLASHSFTRITMNTDGSVRSCATVLAFAHDVRSDIWFGMAGLAAVAAARALMTARSNRDLIQTGELGRLKVIESNRVSGVAQVASSLCFYQLLLEHIHMSRFHSFVAEHKTLPAGPFASKFIEAIVAGGLLPHLDADMLNAIGAQLILITRLFAEQPRAVIEKLVKVV